MKVIVDYPTKQEEQLIIRQNVQGLQSAKVEQVVSTQEIIQAKELARQIYMDEKVEHYILDIVFATRTPEKYKLEKLKPADRLRRQPPRQHQPRPGRQKQTPSSPNAATLSRKTSARSRRTCCAIASASPTKPKQKM